MDGRLVWIFLTVLPSLLAESPVQLIPSGFIVATLGRNSVTFRCDLVTITPDRLQNVLWLLNGSLLESSGLNDTVTEFSSIGGGTGALTFTNLVPDYNHTTINCRGSLQSGSTVASGNSAVLLLQGTLAAVDTLNISSLNSTAFLNWMAPFTLNIHGTPIDITYTTSVVNSTSSMTIYMEEGLIVTKFTYSLPPDSGCDNLVFTVTPVNGAGEGISHSISLSQAVKPSQLMEVLSPILLVYHLSMSAPVCSAEVTLTDKNTGEVITLSYMDLNISSTLMGADIAFINERLALNRQYGFIVNASNINGSAISSGDTSTYDVVKSEVHANPLRIHTEYLPNSNAAGVLYGLFFVGDNGIDFSRSAYLALSRNDSLRYELPSPLPAGVYYVHAYVIKQNGLLSSGETFPATTEVISGDPQISINLPSSPEIYDCGISISGLTLSALCSYTLMSSFTGFLLVVQEKSVDGARRLLVNSTEQGEPQGPVTVQVAVGGAYQVTVFPIREGMGILESNVAYTEEIVVDADIDTPTPTLIIATPSSVLPIILGVGVGIGMLVLLAIILGVVIVRHRSRVSKQLSTPSEIAREEKTEAHMELSSKREGNGSTVIIYEEIGDANSSFTYTQNVVYGHSTTTVSHRLTSDLEVPTGVVSCEQDVKTHYYESIQTTQYQNIDESYKVQLCSAYGVARSHTPSRLSRSCYPGNLSWSHHSNKLHDPKDPCNPGATAALEESCLNNSCECDSDSQENCFAPGIVSEKAENNRAASPSEESCDLEECPAYCVPQLEVAP